MEQFLIVRRPKVDNKYVVYCDGACKGNGKSKSIGGAGAVVMRNDRTVMCELRKKLNFKGVTNNIAEYESLLLALMECKTKGIDNVHIYMDSKLVVEQIRGNWKVKKNHLKIYHQKIKKLIPSFEKFQITHIPRDQNSYADRLANEAVLKNNLE